MAPYESDSSGDEDGDYTQTKVILGFASPVSADESDTTSHLGGRPDWIDPATPPSASLAKCRICNDLMVLLLQLNGDLPDIFPGHERRLYVWSCRRKTCRRKEGSVRASRGVRVSEISSKQERPKPLAKVEEKKPQVNIGETLFGAKSPFGSGAGNPFSTSSSSASNSNPFAKPSQETVETTTEATSSPKSPGENLPKTFASALSLNNPPPKSLQYGPPVPPEPWPQESDFPPPYPLYYLEDDSEYLDKIPDPEIPIQTMDIDEGSGSGGAGKEDKDVYESTIDKMFQKFADRLAQNPEQVIRYDFKGHPLLYSRTDAVGKLFGATDRSEGKVKTAASSSGGKMPRCGNCGAGRVFEVQLTPHAIIELEKEEEGLDGMEWGTVIVGVCERDCQVQASGGGVGYVEEWVGVQWEEMSERR